MELFIDISEDFDWFSGVSVRHKYDSHRCIPKLQSNNYKPKVYIEESSSTLSKCVNDIGLH